MKKNLSKNLFLNNHSRGGAYHREPRERLERRDQVCPRVHHRVQAAGQQDDLLSQKHDRTDAKNVWRRFLGKRHTRGHSLELPPQEYSAEACLGPANHGAVVAESVQRLASDAGFLTELRHDLAGNSRVIRFSLGIKE